MYVYIYIHIICVYLYIYIYMYIFFFHMFPHFQDGFKSGYIPRWSQGLGKDLLLRAARAQDATVEAEVAAGLGQRDDRWDPGDVSAILQLRWNLYIYIYIYMLLYIYEYTYIYIYTCIYLLSEFFFLFQSELLGARSAFSWTVTTSRDTVDTSYIDSTVDRSTNTMVKPPEHDRGVPHGVPVASNLTCCSFAVAIYCGHEQNNIKQDPDTSFRSEELSPSSSTSVVHLEVSINGGTPSSHPLIDGFSLIKNYKPCVHPATDRGPPSPCSRERSMEHSMGRWKDDFQPWAAQLRWASPNWSNWCLPVRKWIMSDKWWLTLVDNE